MRKQWGTWRNLKEEYGITMSEINFFKSNNECDVLFLSDIKGFTGRKICKYEDDKITLIEKRISDGKVFINDMQGIEAVKTLYREKKRTVITYPKVVQDNLFGWIYGVNIQIKNKKGEIVQTRQYSSDFYGNKRILNKKKC